MKHFGTMMDCPNCYNVTDLYADVVDDIEVCEEEILYLEETVLMAFTLDATCNALEAKEIQSFDIMCYDAQESEMIVNFSHYYYDEDSSLEKFSSTEE